MIKIKESLNLKHFCFEYSRSNDKIFNEYINTLYDFNDAIKRNHKIESTITDEYDKLVKITKNSLTEFSTNLDEYRQLLMKKALSEFIELLLQYEHLEIEVNKVLIISSSDHSQYLCDSEYYACPNMNNIEGIMKALFYRSDFDNSLNETAKKVLLSTLLPLDTMSIFPMDLIYLERNLMFIIIQDNNNDYYVIINKNIDNIDQVISVISEDLCNRFFTIDNNKDFQIESNFYFESVTDARLQRVALLSFIDNHYEVKLFKGDE